MPNQSGKIVLVLALFLLALLAAFYFFPTVFNQQEHAGQFSESSIDSYGDNREAIKSTDSIKDYYSKDLKLFLRIPSQFRAEERPAILKLSSNYGLIEVTRNTTEQDSLEDYLNDFDSTRNLKILDKKMIEINNYEVIKRRIEYVNKNQPSSTDMYVYVDNYVYIFSTSEKVLDPVMDQIIQSFEYRP